MRVWIFESNFFQFILISSYDWMSISICKNCILFKLVMGCVNNYSANIQQHCYDYCKYIPKEIATPPENDEFYYIWYEFSDTQFITLFQICLWMIIVKSQPGQYFDRCWKFKHVTNWTKFFLTEIYLSNNILITLEYLPTSNLQ